MKRRITHKILRLMVLFLMPLVVCGSSVEQTEELFYYTFDKRVPIEKVPGKIMIKKKQDLSKGGLEDIVISCLGKAEFDWFNEDICTVLCSDDLVDKTIKRLLLEETILSAGYVYVLSQDVEFFSKHNIEEEPLSIGFVDQIVVKYKDGVDSSVRDGLQKTFDLKETNNRSSLYELYTVAKTVDILSLSNRLFETGYFEYSYPKLITRVTFCENDIVYPNDPYFQYQTALHNTGQENNGHSGTPDCDIDLPEAWMLTMGCDSIIVAVIDGGVTANHPDLPNTRQVRLSGSNFGFGDDDPSPQGNDNHGNACAGVIAATANNGEGIAGIAPLCKIMPVRIDDTSDPGAIAAAIEFAVNNGADIISNSWGHFTSCWDFEGSIVDAIQYAINHNVLILFAAGNHARHALNDDGFVDYPANRNIDGMLTVGASDRYDRQADYSPTDTCIDIVAPSNRSSYYEYRPYSLSSESSDMWTIDIPDIYGYNPWHQDQGEEFDDDVTLPATGINYLSYTGHFGGTSYSCPVVAGVAALVLSVNPQLTPQAVCRILKESADTVGGYLYGADRRCDEMGYGRVNANKAVWMACNATYYTNQSSYIPVDTTIVGCDVYMEEDTLVGESHLRVRARNTVTIEKNFIIGIGTILDIKPY
ncbi:MAG: S8 family serine peptidase [Bacteroidaceae bacterium]|nr:S8 family serine peptidase [Bacteroidaceae bacterium]